MLKASALSSVLS